MKRSGGYAAEERRAIPWGKGLVSLFLVTLYALVGKYLESPLTQAAALRQLDDVPFSYARYALYQDLWSWGWLAVAAILLLWFRKELGAFYRSLMQ